MMKSYFLMSVRAAFAALLFSTLTQTASAAIVTGVNANGNFVNYNPGNVPGISELYVEFFNQQSVQIDFDNGGALQDYIFINIINSTGTGWTGFEYRFIGASITDPIGVIPQTSLIIDVQATAFDPVTNAPSGIWLGFDPLETVGLLQGEGIINTSSSPYYSMILTPTTVPVPAAIWLFGSGLLGLLVISGRRKNTA